MAKHERWELQSKQAAPLNVKIALTKQRIREWVYEYGEDGVYVSFSGGKDSTVLLHIVRELFPTIPAVFCNTGLEYPEIVKFVKTFDNVEIIRPKLPFFKVCEKYGFPLISKEVSECVAGARKYLDYVLTKMQDESASLPDRQTDRQKWHYQKFRQLCGMGEFDTRSKQRNYSGSADTADRQVCSKQRNSWGGEVRQFGKLTGLLANDGTLHEELYRGSDSAERWEEMWGGNAPWRFGAINGILTSQNTFDAGLRNCHRQSADSTADGDKHADGKSNDGEYP